MVKTKNDDSVLFLTLNIMTNLKLLTLNVFKNILKLSVDIIQLPELFRLKILY